MLNITKDKGIPGAWINPNDNIKDDYYDKKEKSNPLLYILDLIVNYIKKIFR